MSDGSEDVIIRTARPADYQTILAITGEVFAPFALEAHVARMLDSRPGQPTWLEIKGQDIGRELEAWPEGCFVAELAGRPVGYATCTLNRLASRGTIANLAVLADCQGRGIGRMLLLRCLDCFRRLGLRQAKIETLECNEVGQHLYPSVGFREAVRQIHYIMPL